MNPPRPDSQVLNLSDTPHASEQTGKPRLIETAPAPASNLRERITATVAAAQAERELERQRAADRVSAELRKAQDKAKAALLLLLSDDVLTMVVGKHASLGELYVGTIKVTKHGIELFRSGGVGAAHTVGERLDIRFDGGILQASQQLKSNEFRSRVADLLTQGIKIEGAYDASAQGLFITFDYEKALG
jgi:hypothetical protein